MAEKKNDCGCGGIPQKLVVEESVEDKEDDKKAQ